MSFSTLQTIETCPLRWALAKASYPAIWSGRGYPPRARLAALGGQVIHAALERITERASLAAPSATVVSVLKALGGFTQLLRDAIDESAAALEVNPRAANVRRNARDDLLREVPALRQRLQQLVSHADGVIGGTVRPVSGPGSGSRHHATAYNNAVPLPYGVHAEVSLRYRAADWYGKADLIKFTPSECEIIDFKSGAPQDEHRTQLRAYSLLWYKDEIANPDHRLATRLRLIYASTEVQIPAPTASELADIDLDLRRSGTAARVAAVADPPVATPTPNGCPMCDVRQLCPTYWEPVVQRALYGDVPQIISDVEIEIHSKQGEYSWHGEVLSSGKLTTGAKILVRARPRDGHFANVLQTGSVIRLLGVVLAPALDEFTDLPTVILTASTEAYSVQA